MVHFTSRQNGYNVTLEKMVDSAELRLFELELLNELAGVSGFFVMEIDVRGFGYFTADAQALFEECLDMARDRGLERVTVLAHSTGFASLFCDMMVHADLMTAYQYLDTAYEMDWESEKESWLGELFEEQMA